MGAGKCQETTTVIQEKDDDGLDQGVTGGVENWMGHGCIFKAELTEFPDGWDVE